MYDLYIANKNYSSWSLRPWALMRELGIEFREHLLFFGQESSWVGFRKISPSGKVPCLVDGGIVVWDSMAIVEYLAERHEGVWPARSDARAWARSAAAEMHSGFGELRSRCSMSCGIRVRLNEYSTRSGVTSPESARCGPTACAASAVPFSQARHSPRSTPSLRRSPSESKPMASLSILRP